MNTVLATNVVLRTAEDYSLRMIRSWNTRFVQGTIDWCATHWPSLVGCVADLAILFLICLLVYLFLRRVLIPLIGRRSENFARGLKAISRPVIWLLFLEGLSNSIDYIPFPHVVHRAIDKIIYVSYILVFLSIFQHAVRGLSGMLIDYFKRHDPKKYNMNKLLLDLSLSIVRLLAWSYVTIFILQEVFHFKVTHLIASAGIAGLAIAFAAKETIANIFGAFAILGCKMFQVGDWIKTGETEGSVEEIGFRSVRIRAFNNGRIIDIPNNVIANSQIENYNRHLFWREYFCFGLTYQTTPDKMVLARKILVDIAKSELADELMPGRPPKFEFSLFDQSSLNLDGYIWFKPMDWHAMRHARGRFNELVLTRFREAGISLAYPTTTVVMQGGDQP